MGFALLVLYLALTYVRPGELVPGLADYRIMLILGPLAVVVSLIGMSIRGALVPRGPQVYLLAALILWMGVTVAAQGWVGGAVEAWMAMLPAYILFVLIVLNVDSVPRLERTATVIVWLTLASVAQGVVAYHFGIGEETFVLHEVPGSEERDSRPSDRGRDAVIPDDPTESIRRIRALGYLNDPNDFAQGILAVLPLVFLRWRPGHAIRNFTAVTLPAAALVYGLYLTKSRGGLLSTAALAAFALHERVGRGWGTVLVAVGSTLLLGASIGGRSLMIDSSALGRLLAWREGLAMLRRSPIFGVGLGNFAEHNDIVAHNSFVHCFAELGLVGYALWLAVLAVTWRQLTYVLRHEPPDAAEPLAAWAAGIRRGMVGFLFAGLFLSRAYSAVLFLILGLATAVGEIARRRNAVAATGAGPLGWIARVAALEMASIALVYLVVSVLL